MPTRRRLDAEQCLIRDDHVDGDRDRLICRAAGDALNEHVSHHLPPRTDGQSRLPGGCRGLESLRRCDAFDKSQLTSVKIR